MNEDEKKQQGLSVIALVLEYMIAREGHTVEFSRREMDFILDSLEVGMQMIEQDQSRSL